MHSSEQPHYPKLVLRRSAEHAPEIAGAVDRIVGREADPISQPAKPPREASGIAVDALLAQLSEVRGDIALRKMMGAIVTKREEFLLTLLNDTFDKLHAKPTPLSDDVLTALDEAKRLLAGRG